MLQNFPEGKTDKTYDKTINLRELKKFFERLFRTITYILCMHTEKLTWVFKTLSSQLLFEIDERLKCLHELGNAFDVFTIKCIKRNMIVGHLPREISWPRKYLLERGVIVTVTIKSENYLKSPLFHCHKKRKDSLETRAEPFFLYNLSSENY